MRRAPPLLAVLSLAFAPVPKPKPRPLPADLRLLQGAREGLGGRGMRVGGDRLAQYRGGELVNSSLLTLTAGARPPACDLKGAGGGAAGGRVYKGTYKVEGDTLTTRSGG